MENSPMRSTPSPGPGASQRARDALLLELGALVFELHRKGRRAPELLQAKASALDEIDARLPRSEAATLPCPHCFSATEPGQLVCLECGEALGVGAPQVPSRRTLLLALAAVVALLGAAAAGFAVSELTSDDGAAERAAAQPAAAASERAEQAPSGGVAGSEESGDDSGAVALAAWPDDEAAYTVILVTSSDEKGAR
ncbi:MAG TPA: hypothetical protein VFQ12_04465, partial [Thermoleophilaceae bacterium]|nr:hypothetical protein [Thermoleophilaceae bacterium]